MPRHFHILKKLIMYKSDSIIKQKIFVSVYDVDTGEIYWSPRPNEVNFGKSSASGKNYFDKVYQHYLYLHSIYPCAALKIEPSRSIFDTPLDLFPKQESYNIDNYDDLPF